MPNLESPHWAVSRCGLALKLPEDVSVRCELVGRKVRRFQGACDGIALGGRPRRIGLTERGSVERLAAETVVGAEPLPKHIVDVGHAVGERLSLLAQVRELSDVGLRLPPDAGRQRGRVLQHVLVHLQLVLDLLNLVRNLLSKLRTLLELLGPVLYELRIVQELRELGRKLRLGHMERGQDRRRGEKGLYSRQAHGHSPLWLSQYAGQSAP